MSHLWEQPIDQASSPQHDFIQLSLIDGRLQLYSENAIYSFEDKYDNFRDAFPQLKLNELAGRNALILGYGLGSIPQIMEAQEHEDWMFTGIEHDLVIIDWATRYHLPKVASPVELVNTDALIYVKAVTRQFDLICVDVFQDDLIPAAFQAPSFWKDCKDRLAPDGLIVCNRLAVTEADKKDTQSFFDHVWLRVFPQGTLIKVTTNWMLINDKNKLKTERKTQPNP